MTHDSEKKISDPKEMYPKLRSVILGTRRPHTVAAPLDPGEPWGVLIDWEIENGTAT